MQYALCPFCLSTLQVTEEQLTAKDGVIRCGHCHDIFDANKNKLTPSSGAAPVNETAKQTNNSISLKNEQLSNSDSSAITPIWENQKTPSHCKTPFTLFSFLLILIFIAQLAYFESEKLTQNTQLQPIFKKLNSRFNLHIPGYKNLEEIHIVQRQISEHPHLANTLSLQLTIKNAALAEQPFPTINVILTSSLGGKIAQGIFTKYDYLEPNQTNDYFAPQALQQINLAFKKPLQEPSGFEISFQH